MSEHEFPMMPAADANPEPAQPPAAEPRYRGPSPRQTLSYLQGLMQGYGIAPKSKLGQNFLVDLNLVDLIVRTAELTRDDAVLEVGTGTGSLTAKMADAAGCVFSVEVDRDMQRIAEHLVGDRTNVELFSGDALARKNELNPDMLAGWQASMTRHGCTRRKLIANLPYVIATPLMSNLLISDLVVERMVVMVQWEIAERLKATVGTKDYNALSVLVQSVADVETVRKVLPTNFYPRPKVDSAIVLLRPNPAKRAKVGDVGRFRVFLRDLYVHRRKNLRQGLVGWPAGRREKTDVDAKLKELGIDGLVRAETLTVEKHLQLCAAFG